MKTRVDGLPNPQLFSQAYQYVWQKNNVDTNLFQLLATELKNGKKEIVIKKCVGDDGVHNPMQIPLKVCFGPVLMEFRGHFPTNYRCSQNIARVEKPWQAAAENVDFVRGLGPRCYHVYTTYKKGDLGDMVKIFRSHRIQMKPVYPIEVASDPGFC